MILESLRTDSSHTVGLGNARFTPTDSDAEHSHWFTINAGVGIDADVIAAMEAQRAAGLAATPTRYACDRGRRVPARRQPAQVRR